MQNLIGDDILTLPDWLRRTDTLVHLYGKTESRARAARWGMSPR